MTTSLVQLLDANGTRAVAQLRHGAVRLLTGVASVLDLAHEALARDVSLATLAGERAAGKVIDIAAALRDGRVLAPIDHPDPAHLMVTGTGLTHLGSAEGRDKMHQQLSQSGSLTDSMRMFKLGLEGGRPGAGQIGVQPEWFYKGDGSIITPPESALVSPAFALDGGEEPEIVGLYLIGPDGAPCRIGYTLGNEFSDHVTERENYLYLAHSKLRPCALGPEVLLGSLPSEVNGTARIRRDKQVVWEKPFLSGEANMSHTLANLEHHHFKYSLFRRPGDVHVHFFGTSTLSFSDGVKARPGDVFEIEAPPFTLPLRNPLAIGSVAGAQAVRSL